MVLIRILSRQMILGHGTMIGTLSQNDLIFMICKGLNIFIQTGQN